VQIILQSKTLFFINIILLYIAMNVRALFATRSMFDGRRFETRAKWTPGSVEIRRCKVFQGGIFRWVPRLSLFFLPYNRRLAWKIVEYRMRHLSMQACVYGILSICRYSTSIFPADFPRARKIRVNLNSMRPRRRSPRLVSRRSWPLVNIKQIFARPRQESFACVIYR